MGLRIKIKSWASDLGRNLDLLYRKTASDNFFHPIKIGKHGEQISATQTCHTVPSCWTIFCIFLEKNGYCNGIWITFLMFS